MKQQYKYSLLTLLLFVTSFVATAQEIAVGGIVLDKNENKGLPYASVIVRDKAGKNLSRYSLTTDENGRFSTKVPELSSLVFSYLGYDSVVVKITKPSENMIIRMSVIENMLDEAVIIGYRKISKADVTASVTVIETKDLVNTPVSNVMELIQGRVPGLNIQLNNGTPGGIPSYSIRGVSDISVQKVNDNEYVMGSTMPLFVVDGIPQEDVTGFDAQGLLSGATISPLAMIPYEDIDNIQVLKDAAATALYGSKGAYGVIIIETKKGDSPKPRISYSGNYVVHTPPRLRDVVTGNAERNLRISQLLENDTSRYHGYNEIHNLQALSDSLNPYFNNNTDWQGIFYQTTYNQTHNLNFSGGDKKFNYKINGNYYTEEGIVKNTDFNRYGIRTGMGYTPNESFSLDVNIAATFTQNSTGSGNAFSQSGVATGSAASSLLPPPSLYTASNAALSVFSIMDENQNTSYDASMNIRYKLPLDIQFTTTLGYKYKTTENEKFTPGILNNNSAEWLNKSSNSYNMYLRSLLFRTVNFWIFRAGLQTGFEYISNKSTGNTITLAGLASDHLWSPGARPSVSGGSASVSEENNTIALIFNPSFGFGGMGIRGDRYVLTPNLRPEANSAYGSQVKWTINPSLGFRWNFSREPFADAWKFMNSGSLRVSWGQSTTYRANRYDIWGTYKLGEETYNGLSIIPIDLANMPNPYLEPVTSTQWNLGSEMALWDNKIRFTGEVYYKQVDNQLGSTPLANHNAFGSVRSTETSIVNYGTEFLFGIRPLSKNSPWVLDVSASFAINKDVIAKLPNDVRQIINSNAEVVNRLGSNAMGNYLYVYKGVYAKTEDVPVNPLTGKRLRVGGNTSEEAYFKAGDPIWVDLNGDYIIDEKDKVIVGNSQPRMTGGLSINLRYKAFSINTNSSFTLRRDIINKALADRFSAYGTPKANLQNSGALTPIEAYDFWKKDKTDAYYPNPFDYTRSGIINPFRNDQTLFMEDGSYFKINGVSLAYTIPTRFLNHWGLKRMQLNFSMNNIYTFSKYSGINPENVNSLGYDTSGGYPNSRTYTAGLIIDF
ncbi:MAG: SusC/RagA family TonB-linked outer membrane protein [Dysgonamonadaceae bacterium]|jgi:TonB-linked SusC/RagA family outer membrane protein|nr:SusC/RagA family TonB-linked outer membrane protein [Dysgonamonadaceae bacterium]